MKKICRFYAQPRLSLTASLPEADKFGSVLLPLSALRFSFNPPRRIIGNTVWRSKEYE